MNLEQRLFKENKQKEIKKKQTAFREDEEDVETYMYAVRKPMEFINENTHGMFDISNQSGINTAKSVFDRGAVFKTGI